MGKEQFISQIATYVKKYAPQYGIKVVSPIIAQAILESASGTSELAINAHNYFGLKWRENRCPTAIGYYVKVGSEQNTDGSYTSSVMQWMKFADMESGVNGYFDFINTSNYSNLKGVTDPRTYLENIKADGYATSLNYVDNLMKVISSYDLTKYDKEANMKIIIGAGHGLYTSGKRCMKKLDPKETREWYLNDRIADKVEAKLKNYDCEVIRAADSTGKLDVTLANRVSKANNSGAEVYISIHHNAGVNGGKGGGTVVFYYPTGDCKAVATRLYKSIVAETGLVGNRATPVANGSHLYVVRKTKMPCFLCELGFMDSATDVPIILTEEYAEKAAQGIVNFLVKEYSLKPLKAVTSQSTAPQTTYRVQVGAFKSKANAEKLKKELTEKGYKAIIVS